MSDKEGNAAEIGQDSRKRKRTTQGSQTDDELSTAGETSPSMAATLTEINRKLDNALAGIKEIEELKEKQLILRKENSDLRESLEFAHKSIVTLTEKADAQQKTLSTLTESVNKLTQAVDVEKGTCCKARKP